MDRLELWTDLRWTFHAYARTSAREDFDFTSTTGILL